VGLITINPEAAIKFLLTYGHYIGVYFFVQAVKKAFKIPRRFIPLVPFIAGWILAPCLIIARGVDMSLKMFIAKAIIEGLVVGVISLAARALWTRVVLGK
jgi:hypothetical protein